MFCAPSVRTACPNWPSRPGIAWTKAPASAGATVTGALTVTGDLTVNGTTTTINTATVEVEDNILQLNCLEADDCIALTVDRIKVTIPDANIFIIANDMDYLQLASDKIFIYNLKFVYV